ncbi:gar1/Naf1 RNA binding domain-containing protein [Hirsutella rhossiliensis]|uniref:H/ACA ribonucleoprotein complex non-core subunit NAF1 n=1 Tax=Hirsutella rhossiliensis TaxID=111463 RepID=A0A9P8SKM6_9HYPO|nr:gar1/Naf1 RNA binding domain-containing protein [Hirsutella rhossiliensis]KAH0966558.1 gar1/Naf1 RNA binding domain-containing protein [Hirsutella rhossiliensis]
MPGFQIPGLGQAKPNETLPPLPADMLADAAPVDQTQEPHHQAEAPAPTETKKEQNQPDAENGIAQDQAQPDGDPMAIDRPENPPSLTCALEAAIGGLEDTNMTQAEARAEPQPDDRELQPDQESSSSDSSDEDSDNEQYELLGVEETARLLMEMDGGLDDEGEKGDKATSAAQLRTKNELPEEPIPKPDITVTPEMKVEELGSVEHIVEGTILVKAITPGEYQVLDTGSVLCTEDRVVIGVVAETIGKVLQPMYTVRFSSQDEINEFGVQVGTKIFYPVDHASYVFTEPLKSLKGSDASNIHDEEVGADEMEFSDDEKEADYKRALKNKKNKSKGPGEGGRGGRGGRGPHPLRQEMAPDGELNYDDGPYKPLARPPGFGSGAAPGEPVELPPRPQFQRGGGRRGDRRGRGGRGRDSGRGGGRGGYDQPRDGHSLPPRGYQQQPPNQQPSNAWPSNIPAGPTQGSAPSMPVFGFQLPPGWPQQPHHQAHGAPVTAPPPPPPPPPPPGWPSQDPAQGHQGVNGTFVNPAFVAALMSQMQGQNGQQPWGGQQQQPPPPGGWS